MSKKNTHITVVGAGLIGTSLSLCFQSEQVNIEILEKNLNHITTENKKDTRPISLSYSSYLILKSLDIWSSLMESACPIKTVHVSEQGRFGCTRITADEQGVPALGYVVPFGELQAAIYQKVTQSSNITITAIDALNTIETNEFGATLSVQTPNGNLTKKTDLLIGADGTNSACRRLLNIATCVEDKRDQACIFQLTLSEPHNHVAYERFTKQGVLAILPLQNQLQARLVWSMTPHNKNTVNSWSETERQEFIKTVFDGRLSVTNIAESASFLLKTTLAETQIVSGAVLLGNAAHTIYPVAAQGFNLGLRESATLSEILQSSLADNENIANKHVLKRYMDACKPHQDAIIKFTNQLTPLFDIQLPAAGYARGLGLLAMDVLTPLKNRLAHRAMGIAGKRPQRACKSSANASSSEEK